MKYILSEDELIDAVRNYLVEKKLIPNEPGLARINVRLEEGVRTSWMREPRTEIITTFSFDVTPPERFKKFPFK